MIINDLKETRSRPILDKSMLNDNELFMKQLKGLIADEYTIEKLTNSKNYIYFRILKNGRSLLSLLSDHNLGEGILVTPLTGFMVPKDIILIKYEDLPILGKKLPKLLINIESSKKSMTVLNNKIENRIRDYFNDEIEEGKINNITRFTDYILIEYNDNHYMVGATLRGNLTVKGLAIVREIDVDHRETLFETGADDLEGLIQGIDSILN